MPLINADLKQIEIVIFAHLCQDPYLTQLLKEGKDLHKMTASIVLDIPEEGVTDNERGDAKAGNFGIIYGNGPPKLAKTTGRDVEWCKNYIDSFYEMFPKAKEWHDKIQKIVNATGQLRLFTGMILKFRKFPAKYEWQKRKGITESYNPPDIKNHPVQHLASLVTAIFIGQFFRQKAIYKRDKYLMINTVHDSLMLDCKSEFVEEAKQDILEIVDRIPDIVYKLWNERIEVPIKVDISVGDSWYDL